MRTFIFVLLTAGLAAAQASAPVSAAQEPPAAQSRAPASAAQEPPKEVDDALRARVTQFFQASVDRKYRLAMDVVAEDSQDYFLEMDKRQYYGFEIQSIKYSDEFKRALVVVLCDIDMNMMPQGKVRVKAPLTTQWKLEDGQWFWFASRTTERKTPFGMFGATHASGAKSPAPAVPSILPGMGQLPAVSNRRAISADKTEIVLDASQPSSDSITLSNGLDGAVSIELYVLETPGLTAKAERDNIPAKSSTRVVFEYKPSGERKIGKVLISILPTGPLIPVKVTFKGVDPKPGKAASGASHPKGATSGKSIAPKQ